jgi:hypothetical protein
VNDLEKILAEAKFHMTQYAVAVSQIDSNPDDFSEEYTNEMEYGLDWTQKLVEKIEAMLEKRKLLNLFVQDEKDLKGLIGVYLVDEVTFKKEHDNDIIRKLPVQTTQGDYDPDYLLWDAYLVDLVGSKGLVLVKKEQV